MELKRKSTESLLRYRNKDNLFRRQKIKIFTFGKCIILLN